MMLPRDYEQRVYAGVLGKIIGVYLGRPFEGWSYERIMAELGEVNYYVHERRNLPLIVTDDDISGTFTFLRALPDYGNRRDLTPAQIGQTWLNYIIEKQTILWWGGMGNSTEHTAYLRLKHGVPAPRSGSIALNGQVVAEQIGAQIFIDGWAMVAPGDPELAADLAGRAGSVSHDGAAVHGAQVLAAMEAQAFVDRDLRTLLDTGVSLIPRDSIIARLVADVREWREQYADWRVARARIEERYGYHIYGGNCHIVPNHALIMLGLLYGDDDFQKSLMITNTSGWDTDCNSGNVGCLMGIKNGLEGLAGGPDWRGPVADRLYLPTADGGRAISDAVHETYQVVNIARALQGQPPLAPKDGARFHWELPGAVQGWQSVGAGAAVTIENVEGYSQAGQRSLRVRFEDLAHGGAACIGTPTFIPPEAHKMGGYTLLASPMLYPGQEVRARVVADRGNAAPVRCGLFVQVYNSQDALEAVAGPEVELAPGTAQELKWRVPDQGGQPIGGLGVVVHSSEAPGGSIYLDFVTWVGTPEVRFTRPEGGTLWRRAWVAGVDHYTRWWPEPFWLTQDEGTGLLLTGTREWTNYTVTAGVRPHMAARAGLAARVQGMRRWYGLLLCADGQARLIKSLDGEQVLAQAACEWVLDRTYQLELTVHGSDLVASIDGKELCRAQDGDLATGGIALVADEGTVSVDEVAVCPPVGSD